jgi:fucose 4-O-acetylase-like acetyltransferase
MKNRVAWIDVLKGMGILLVVIIHATGNQTVQEALLFVAVPIFIFISGYIFDASRYPKWRDFFLNRFNRRITTYAVWSVLSYAIVIAENCRSTQSVIAYLAKMVRPDFVVGFLTVDGAWLNEISNFPLWFLPGLFAIENIFYSIARLRSSFRIALFLACFLVGTQMLFFFTRWQLTGLADIVVTQFMTFGFGYLFKKVSEKRALPDNKTRLAFCVVLLSLFTVGAVNYQLIYHAWWGTYYQFAVTVLGVTAGYFVAKYSESISPLRYFGKNSLVLLVLCVPLERFTCYLFYFINYSFFDRLYRLDREIFTIVQVIGVFTLAVPCIVLITNRLPFLVGDLPTGSRRKE